MTNRIATVLEAHVPLERQGDLQAAYREAAGETFPPGLVRSVLLQDSGDPTLWRIETIWESFDALAAMRASGLPPRGILMFRAAGAEPKVSAFRVVEDLHAP
jgi:hypothetical protein